MHQVEALLAERASILVPLQTILEVAQSVLQSVVAIAGLAKLVLVLDTSVNHAGTALELVMGQAFRAHSAVVLQAALLHLQAGSCLAEIVATLARNTTIIVIGLALLDNALVVLQHEGLVTLRTGVI